MEKKEYLREGDLTEFNFHVNHENKNPMDQGNKFGNNIDVFKTKTRLNLNLSDVFEIKKINNINGKIFFLKLF